MSRYDDVTRAWDDRAFGAYSAFTDRPRRHLFIGTIVVAALIAAVVLGGWWIGWWFKTENTNRESHLFRDGDAPENPTVEDVMAVIRKTGRFRFMNDWGFEQHVSVNGKPVKW